MKHLEQAIVLLDRFVLIVSIKICTFIFMYERCYRICLSDIQWNILLQDNAEDQLSNALSSVPPRNLKLYRNYLKIHISIMPDTFAKS